MAPDKFEEWNNIPGLTGPVSFLLELGGTTGFTTQEGLGDADDSAVYVGISVTVPIGVELTRWKW